jgi:hypothetical protein
MDDKDFMKDGYNVGHTKQYGWPRFKTPKWYLMI